MAKPEYRMVYHYGHWLKVKLANQERNVMVNCNGTRAFVISRRAWVMASVCKEDTIKLAEESERLNATPDY